MMRLEEYLQQTDKLAQAVVTEWALRKQAGTVPNPGLDDLFEKACLFVSDRKRNSGQPSD